MRAGSLLPIFVASFVAISFLVFAPAAHAETIPIEIQFTGLNFILDGASQDIFDAKASNSTRAGTDPTKSDPLNSVEFQVDSTVYRDTTDVYADLYVKDASGLPKGGGFITTGGNGGGAGGAFGFDLFGTADAEGPWKLELNISSLDVYYIGGGIAVAALGKVTSISGQSLPFSLADIDTSKDVSLTFSSSSLKDITNDGTSLTAFKAVGSGNITATLVPEPSTFVGLLMGALVLVASASARRKR